jgi:hypothetical protein
MPDEKIELAPAIAASRIGPMALSGNEPRG